MANDLNIGLGNVPFSLSENHRYAKISEKFNPALTTNARMIKNKTLQVSTPYNNLISYNYGSYQKGAKGKIIYFFITNINYINETTSEINIEVDWFSTDYNSISLKTSSISRMHPSRKDLAFTDYPLAPESFANADKQYYLTGTASYAKNNLRYVVGVTNQIPPVALGTDEQPKPTTDYLYIQNPFPAISGSTTTAGILNGCLFYVFSSLNEAQLVLKNAVDWGYSSSVTGIWVVPAAFISTEPFTGYYTTASEVVKVPETHPFTVQVLTSTDTISMLENEGQSVDLKPSISEGTSLYSKCYSSQFCQAYIRTAGITKYYNPESIAGDTLDFIAFTNNSPDAELFLYPDNYQGVGQAYPNFYEGVSVPVSLGGSLTADNVNNSYRQAKVQLSHDIALNLVGGISNVVNAGNETLLNSSWDTKLSSQVSDVVKAGIYSAGDMVKSAVNAYNTMRTPDLGHATVSSSGVSCTPLQLPSGGIGIDVGLYRINDADMLRLNKYFSMWGYNYAGAVLEPIIRNSYSFIQGDINFDGNISAESRAYIKALFSAGVTIWGSSAMYEYDA